MNKQKLNWLTVHYFQCSRRDFWIMIRKIATPEYRKKIFDFLEMSGQ